MLILLTREDVARALDSPTLSPIHDFLRLRISQMQDTRILITEPTDRLPTIEAVLGYRLLHKSLPAWDWAMDHGQLIEVAFNISDQMTDVLVVPDDGSKPALVTALRKDTIALP